jgi:hypothetical protein
MITKEQCIPGTRVVFFSQRGIEYATVIGFVDSAQSFGAVVKLDKAVTKTFYRDGSDLNNITVNLSILHYAEYYKNPPKLKALINEYQKQYDDIVSELGTEKI